MNDPTPKGRIRKALETPVHGFLFTTYAVLFLWSQNVGKVIPREVVVPLIVALAATAIVFCVGWLILRRVGAAAVLATASSVLFFSYGHVFDLVNGREFLGVKIGETKLIVLWGLLAVTAVAVTALWKTSWRSLSYALNVVLAVLIVLALVPILTAAFRGSDDPDVVRRVDVDGKEATRKPDIYYFILDRYAGADSLKRFYNFDNSGFIRELEKRGFYIADKARGNYPKTPHSLATSMNISMIFPRVQATGARSIACFLPTA
jgi:hypothetical protein